MANEKKNNLKTPENIESKEYLAKQKRIKKELNRLKKVFAEIDENKKMLVQTVMEDVAFMTVTMQDLREGINKNGVSTTYQNGENQHGTKQSPEAQLYNQMSQKQTQAMKLLLDCLPKTPAKKDDTDEFEDFVESRDG